MFKRLAFFIIFFLNWSLVVGHPSTSLGMVMASQSSHWSFADSPSISQIEMKRDRGYDYLDIYTTGWSEAKGLLLEDKLYLEFPGVSVSGEVEILKRKSSRIKSIEVVQKDEATTRVIVTLKKDIDYDIVNVFGRNKSVIEISDRLANIYAYQFAWEEKFVKKKSLPLKTHKFEPLVSRDQSLRGKTIILDPGHGGDDPGAFSISGVAEKQLTLAATRKTAELLRAAGASVIMTRNEDRRSGLKDIAAFANNSGADIFISIHYNSTLSSKIGGTETYYHNPISKKFAEKMHEAIVRGLRRKDRGLHRTPFYVVKNTSIPSVLLEPAYISNSEEDGLARTEDFQAELASDIVKGVKEYFRNKSR